MKNVTALVILPLAFSIAAADWQDAGVQSGALTLCAQLPYEFSAEQKASFSQLSDALYFASEKHSERKQAFLDGTMRFLASLERTEKAVFSDGESAVMATLTEEKCLNYAVSAEVILSSSEIQ